MHRGSVPDVVVIDPSFWRGRRVLVTGHTGFKGSWLCAWLLRLEARVCGLALAPVSEPNLFSLLRLDGAIDSHLVDLLDVDAVRRTISATTPEVVVHMAAQPLVHYSLAFPRTTIETNVTGLVNLLDVLRNREQSPAIVCVTSDKVYAEGTADRAFVESDPLGGDDPYSASKACAEIVAAAYRASYGPHLRLCTARAGNVIGGGDWSQNRLVPDVIRAMECGYTPVLRNPRSTRPWQHVLDALQGYLLLAQGMARGDRSMETAWNFGPDESKLPTVEEVALRVMRVFGKDAWNAGSGNPIERATLRVDASKARERLGWRSRLPIDDAILWTATWYARHAAGEPVDRLVAEQIDAYEALT